jgi:hypothetical protein
LTLFHNVLSDIGAYQIYSTFLVSIGVVLALQISERWGDEKKDKSNQVGYFIT